MNESRIIRPKYLNAKLMLPILIVFIGVGVYYDYLAFNKLFLFKKYASDSLTQFFPWLYFYSKNLSDLDFPFWSFQFELGMNIYNLSINHNIFDAILALSGKERLIYTIPYIIILKILVAGLLFFAYLKKIGFTDIVAVICSISFGFCGYMVVNGHWYHYQNYAVFIALALFCFERWFQNGRWLAMVLIFGFSNLIGVLQIAQVTIFFSVYILFRCIISDRAKLSAIAKQYLQFGILFGLGVGISAFYLLPNIDAILQSARSDSSVGEIVQIGFFEHVLSIPAIEHWCLIFLRYLSSDIMGSFQHYRGVGNYLENPAAYIGLATFALLPGVMWIRPLKKKMALLGLLLACFIYFLFPFLRTAFNLFASSTYKYGILYISIFLILVAGYNLNNYFSNPDIKYRFEISMLVTLFILFSAVNSIAFLSSYNSVIDKKVLMVIDTFLIVYMLLFLLSLLGRYQLIPIMIVGLMALEVAAFAKITVRRGEGIPPEFITQNECYFDKNSIEAIDYLRMYDQGFYRIANTVRCTLNDALIQDYNGTTGYHGFASSGLVNFYYKMGLSIFSPRTASYRYGFERSPYLLSLFSVKYFISDDIFVFPETFKLIKRFGNRYLYENPYHLPLGINFSYCISPLEFEKQRAYSARRALLLNGFVTESEKEPYQPLKIFDSGQIKEIQNISKEVINWENSVETKNLRLLSPIKNYSFHYISTSEDPKIIFQSDHTNYYNDLIILVEIESAFDTLGQIFWKTDVFSAKNSRIFKVTRGRKLYKLDLGKVTFNGLRLDVGNESDLEIKINKIQMFTHRVHGFDFEKTIAQLKSDALQITEFKDDAIKGIVETESNKMLFFSIPFDRGWVVKINGERKVLEKVNFGFMGVKIPPGRHTVELKFRPRLLEEGFLITALSLCLLVIFQFRPKKNMFVPDFSS